MPVHLRIFYYNKIVDILKKERDSEKSVYSGIPKLPDFNAKSPSKVRMRK